jgi:hypothetical protein
MLAEDVRAELAAGQVRDQVSPVRLGAVWVGGEAGTALVGDVTPADGGSRKGPGCHGAILLFRACGAGEVEQVGRPGLHELHQRAASAYMLVPVRCCAEQHPADASVVRPDEGIRRRATDIGQRSGDAAVVVFAIGEHLAHVRLGPVLDAVHQAADPS